MRFCWKCGNQAEDYKVFCEKCGTNMNQQPAQSPQGQPPPVYPVMAAPPPPASIPRREPPPPPARSPAAGGKSNNLMYVITGILVVALLAVGVMYGTGVGKLSKANNHVDELTANVADLGTQLTAAQATSAGLQTQLAATQASVADLQTQLTSAKSDLSASQGKVTSLTADLSTANAKVTSLTADLATANSKVTTIQTSLDKANADKATLQSQLTSVQAKYPLKDFPDYGTFYAWVKAHVQPYTTTYGAWYSHALFVQMAAMNDGYFVSACIDYDEDVYNLALVGSTLYGWDPEDGIVYSEGTWPR